MTQQRLGRGWRSGVGMLVIVVALGVLPPGVAHSQPETTVAAMVERDDPVLEQVVEGETLVSTAVANSGFSARPHCCGEVLLLGLNDGPGTFFTVQIDVPAAGRYELSADYAEALGYATHVLEVDGVQLGGEVNNYADTSTVARRVRHGEIDLTAGTHELTFTVTGKDERSNAFRIGLDRLRLRRVPVDARVALTPSDGAFVRGVVPVYGYSRDPDDEVALTVDGRPVDDRAAIGGSASLVFDARGPEDRRRASRAVVKGIDIPLDSPAGRPSGGFATSEVDVPGELLAAGQNTVAIVGGAEPGAEGDDLEIRNVRLELPDGTVLTDPDMTGTYAMDPDPGSDQQAEVDFRFTIPPGSDDPGPAYEPARAYALDTQAIEDGEHTVSLSASGVTQTHTVLVDNTAPTLASTSPMEGERLKGDFTLDAAAADEGSGTDGVTATVDGEAVPLGTTLSTDHLTDGEHTFVFTAADRAGNVTTETVTATTVRERPDTPGLIAPADGATGVAVHPELRVVATDPAGDELEVTFLEASVADPDDPGARASLGTSPAEPPAGLETGGEAATTEQREAAAEVDGQYVETAAAEEFPFQRFDLRVNEPRGDISELEVTWRGTTRHGREVTLYAQDLRAQRWVPLSRGGADAEGRDFTLTGMIDAASMLDGDVVRLLLQGRDPFDPIDDEPDEAFKDPDSYDFALAHIPDTQYLSEGAADGRTAFGQAYRDINQWIVDNADERKIVYAAHTGDLIENWVRDDDTEQEAREEFAFASQTMAILDDASIPNGVTPGNHDNRFGSSNELYNEYFPPSRYDDEPWYGDSWRPGDNQNHYDLFEAGGQEFIVVYLGFIAGDEEMDWANEVLAEHRDRKAIFATHEYLRPSSARDGTDGPYSDGNEEDQGAKFFNEVVLPNDNVFLTLSGHVHGVAHNIKRDVGRPGRTVVEVVANYQDYQVDGEQRVGHFRLLQFDVDRAELSVNTYSPSLDDHNAVEYDTEGRYDPEADEFSVPVDLATRDKAVATDGIRLDVRTDRVVGTAAVPSGAEAASRWEGLEPETDHAWYARAADDFGGVAESEVFTFTTGAGDGPGDGGPGEGGPGAGGPGGPGDGGPGGGGPGRPDGGPGGGPGGPPDEDDGRPAPRRPGPRGPDDADRGPGRGRGGPSRPVDPPGEGPAADDPFALTRLAGAERAETAARISAATFDPGVDVAYVATMADFPDALTGAPLAGVRGGPVLLVGEDVPEPTRAELERLQPGRIAILGGTHVVPADVEDGLGTLTEGGVERLAGDTRFGTAAAVAVAYEPGLDTVFVASGTGFPDALAGGAAAADADAPLLLVAQGGVPEETREALERLRPQRVVVLGGEVAVSDAVAESLAEVAGAPVERVSGVDRYATAAAVSASFAEPGGTAFVASGADFPDALTAVPAAAAADAPVLLTPPDGVPASVAEELARLRPSRVTVVGGDAAVPPPVLEELGEAARR